MSDRRTSLELHGVTKAYPGTLAVDDVRLELAGGQIHALVGANGAGKSTLLSVLAGLLKPDAGEVRLGERPLGAIDRRELARRRAYLPQNPRAEWPISVERVVALGLLPQLPGFGGLPGGLEPRLTQAIEACDLAAQRQQPATTLSGGELARAMLARALIGDPDGKSLGTVGDPELYFFMRVVAVAVNHRVDHGFANGHPDFHQILVPEPRTLRHPQRQFLGAVHAFERRVQKPFHGFRNVVLVFPHIGASKARPSRIRRINYPTSESQEETLEPDLQPPSRELENA